MEIYFNGKFTPTIADRFIEANFFFSVALQSFWTLAASCIGVFLSCLDIW
jgi:hypothetical protein